MASSKPQQVEFINGEYDRLIMVRGSGLEECLATAGKEAAACEMHLVDPSSVRLSWMRVVPCPQREHEHDGVACETEGRPGFRRIVDSYPGRGAWQGIWAEVAEDDADDH